MKKRICIYIIIGIILSVLTVLLVTTLAHRNEKLELTMKTNAGVPYEWVYQIEDESIVKLDKKYIADEEKNVNGGYIAINYVFKGLKKGKTKVTFKYVSIIDKNEVSKEEQYILKVDSHKNVSLVVIDD